MIDYKQVGENIKRARQDKNMTQDELSGIVDIGSKYLSSIETGGSKPSLDLLGELSTALEVEISYFLDGTNPGLKNYKYDKIAELFSKLEPNVKGHALKVFEEIVEISKESKNNE